MANDPCPVDLEPRICPVFYSWWEPGALESDVGLHPHLSSWAFSLGGGERYWMQRVPAPSCFGQCHLFLIAHLRGRPWIAQ